MGEAPLEWFGWLASSARNRFRGEFLTCGSPCNPISESARVVGQLRAENHDKNELETH